MRPALGRSAPAASHLVPPPSIERVRTLPFLKDLPEELLQKLRPNLSEHRFAPGEVILRTGQYCDGAYYLAEGLVEVRVGGPEFAAPKPGASKAPRWIAKLRKPSGAAEPQLGDARVTLADLPVDGLLGDRAVLEAGEIFGEMSALSRYPVSSDVVAASDATCWLLGTAALRHMFDQPELSSFKSFFDARYRQRTLASVLRRVGLFREVDERTLEHLRERAQLVSYKPGRVIVEQGAEPDGLYIVRGGYVKVAARTGGDELAVTYLRKGDHEGEVSLLLGEPWPFSLTALEHVELIKIARADFGDVLAKYPAVASELWKTAVARLKQRGAVLSQPLGAKYLHYAIDSGLIHGESVLLIDLNTCTRCDECVRACADVHDGTPRFIREGSKFRNFSVPTACYQCTDPVCMIGCPTGAISRPLGTLEVTINKDTCIGCKNCFNRCPWGNIQMVPSDRPGAAPDSLLASKCDLCVGRADGPACVQMCPHGAAVRVNFKQIDEVRRLIGGSDV